jgi:glucose-1-phosphate adenylyltransferase
MDLIDNPPKFDVKDRLWNIYSRNMPLAPHYIGNGGKVSDSTITEGCIISGTVSHSVISAGVIVEEGASITDSVIMSGVKIGKNAVIKKAVIGPECIIGDNVQIGVSCDENNKYSSHLCTDDIVLLEGGCEIAAGADIPKGSMVEVKKA